jgi:4-hydroxy-tetrahydrodipicolinate synthase
MAAVAPRIDSVLQDGIQVSPAPIVFSAVPTLFSSDGEVDTGANRALYKHLAGLLDGLFVAGTTGEFPALDDSERLSLIELALAEAGPDRVIAHVGTPDARHSARLARAASALGATRLAAITPYYLPARPDEVGDHYRRIRDAAAGAELYAYIFPERTGLRVHPPLFAAVASATGLAGAKLSGSAAGELARYVAAAPGLRMFSGDDSNPAATMRAGGAGVISGRSSAYPEVYAALMAALGSADPGRSGRSGESRDSGDEQAAARHQLALDRIVGLGASIGRLKHALALRGLGGTTARMTVDPPDASLSAAIAAEVAALLFRSAVNQGPGSRVQYAEVRRKRGGGPHLAR